MKREKRCELQFRFSFRIPTSNLSQCCNETVTVTVTHAFQWQKPFSTNTQKKQIPLVLYLLDDSELKKTIRHSTVIQQVCPAVMLTFIQHHFIWADVEWSCIAPFHLVYFDSHNSSYKMGAEQSKVRKEEVEKLPQYTIMGGSAKFEGRWSRTCYKHTSTRTLSKQ